MQKRISRRVWRALSVLALLATAVPAHAEKLVFDHRLYAPLKAVLDSGDAAMVSYDSSNPRYVVDLIAIKGRSSADWSEALEIIARTPSRGLTSAADWAAELRARSDKTCPNTVTPLAEDANSLTFERHSPDCPGERAETALTRVIAGKRSLFLLSVLFKGVPDADTRLKWLSLLGSAHIE